MIIQFKVSFCHVLYILSYFVCKYSKSVNIFYNVVDTFIIYNYQLVINIYSQLVQSLANNANGNT